MDIIFNTTQTLTRTCKEKKSIPNYGLYASLTLIDENLMGNVLIYLILLVRVHSLFLKSWG